MYIVDQEKSKGKKRRVFKQTKNIPPQTQRWLWNQPTSCTQRQIPGKLSLCIGLPVMIRSNLATELCITKGQEGSVYGWVDGTGSKGQRVLEVLFVRLANPPQTVQFEGLPENVVPVYATTTITGAVLPIGPEVKINRTQVEVQLNFAMTDYASQGKTRPYNPVDLSSSKSQLHVYTALSRGTSAAGTLILDKYGKDKITAGISGALRGEF
ncbi:hypothetical protein BDN72DRAFT_777552, partial [Pluteus cervinus]